MTSEQTKALFQKYQERLAWEFPPKRGDTAVLGGSLPTHTSELQHAAWMCVEGQKLVDEGKLEKANRWLGFVQGVLWMGNQLTIDQMRDDSRGV